MLPIVSNSDTERGVCCRGCAGKITGLLRDLPIQISRDGRLRPALANTALVLFSLVVSGLFAFAVGEAFFRIKFGGAVNQAANTSLYEFDQQRG